MKVLLSWLDELADLGDDPDAVAHAMNELGLAVDLVAVIPSTENMPSGTAVKPGDVITQYGGKTVEVIDLKSPEGVETLLRLVEGADALIRLLNAERIGRATTLALLRGGVVEHRTVVPVERAPPKTATIRRPTSAHEDRRTRSLDVRSRTWSTTTGGDRSRAIGRHR